jgi:hypothetical protein
MLGTLLEKLGGLLPKNFIIASFFPMLVFAFLNGVMLYLFSEGFRSGFDKYLTLDAGKQTLYGFTLLIGVAFIAYIFSTLNLFLREMLEGQHLLAFLRLQTPMVSEKQRKLDTLENDLDKYRRQFFLLMQNSDSLIQSLTDARAVGNQQQVECKYSDQEPVSIDIKSLKAVRTRNELIKFSTLKRIVKDLADELEKYPTEKGRSEADDLKNKRQLDADHTNLRLLIYYAQGIAENNYIEAFNEKEFKYSRYKVNATSMGNIAESVRSYARSRYEINLDPFWSRFQKLIQADNNFYASLLDAKTQLDFLVSLFWLTTLFTVIWLSFLFYTRVSWLAFILVGVIGAGLGWIWYKIATRNYLAFADILRTAIDLFRFDLLTALHSQLPKSSDHERQIWAKLNQLIGYGENRQRVPYTHQPKT